MTTSARAELSPHPEDGKHEIEPVEREALVSGMGRRPERSPKRLICLVLVVAFGSSLARVTSGESLINKGGWAPAREFVAAALHPDLSWAFLRITWEATLTTVSFAVLGAALSVVIGLVFGVLATESWWRRDRGAARQSTGAGWRLMRTTLALPRGIHEAVWALLLVNILGLNPLVGVLAIAIPYGAITAKVFSEVLDEAAMGPFSALRSLGVGRLKAFAYSLGPQSAADLISYSFYRFECAIRAAAILGVIGAGGLGFQIALSFQALRYPEIWTLIFALIIVSGSVDLWSSSVRSRSRRPAAPAPTAGQPELQRDRYLVMSVSILFLLVVVSAIHLDLDLGGLWASRSRAQFQHLLSETFPISVGRGELAKLGRATVDTLAMAIVASTLAWAGGLGVAFLAAGRRGPRRSLASLSAPVFRLVLLFCRAVPPPVWALLFVFVIFPGPLPGTLALAVYNFGILGRLMAEVVQNVDDKPVAVLRTQGVSAGRAFLYGTAPLTIARFASLGLYRWEVTMREVVVVGLVGAGGLGRLLNERLAAFDYSAVTLTVTALMGLTLFADLAGASIRRGIR